MTISAIHRQASFVRATRVRTVTSDAKPVTEAVQTSVPHVTLLDRTHILALISGRAHGGLAIHAASAPRLSIVLQVSNVTQARA